MAKEGDILGGRYLLRRLLGDGGMGHVFLAENIKLGSKCVAVKTLKPEYLGNREIVARFLDEALAASKVEHDNIVEVFDADVDGPSGTPYIVQQYLRGTNLREHLDAAPARQLSPTEALDVLVPIMGALIATHRQRIIHRDIKPENIFLVKTSSGNTVPKLIDFGIAKHLEDPELTARSSTRAGTIWGTFDYMSPEQARGERAIDTRADIWSMGAVMYEAVTGRLPYEGVDGHYALLERFRAGPPPRVDRANPTLPRDLADAVERALQTDPAARFPTMAAFISAIIHCQCYQSTVTWRAIPLASPDFSSIPDLSDLARFATEEHPLPPGAPAALSPRRFPYEDPDDASSPGARTMQLVIPEPWTPRRLLPLVASAAFVLVGVLVVMRLRNDAPPAPAAITTRTVAAPLARAEAPPVVAPVAASAAPAAPAMVTARAPSPRPQPRVAAARAQPRAHPPAARRAAPAAARPPINVEF